MKKHKTQKLKFKFDERGVLLCRPKSDGTNQYIYLTNKELEEIKRVK